MGLEFRQDAQVHGGSYARRRRAGREDAPAESEPGGGRRYRAGDQDEPARWTGIHQFRRGRERDQQSARYQIQSRSDREHNRRDRRQDRLVAHGSRRG